jgi:Rubredoxin metal binding domain
MKLLFSLLLLLASSCGGWLLSPPAAENLLRIHKLVLLVEPPTSSSTSRSLCIHGRRAFPALLMAFERRRRDFENEKDDDVEDDDDDDDEPFPDVNVQNFCPPSGASFGFNRGHSSPATRKAVGTSASSMARIHICTNCGAESVKWMGRCTVCKEWNTMQEHQVIRQAPGSTSNSILGGSGGGGRSRPVFGRSGPRTSSSWLDGVGDGGGSYGSDSPYNDGKPIRITDLYDKEKSNDGSTSFRTRNKRIVIPQDDELNTVLGGGILPGTCTTITV